MLKSLKTLLGFSLLGLIGVWIGCSSNASPVASYSASKTHTSADTDTDTASPASPADPVIAFADTSLKRVVEEALLALPALGNGYDQPPLTATNLKQLTRLDAVGQGIQSLAGLEHATNLDTLNLRDNGIKDISPLAGLTELKVLYLDRNSISNTSPLTGLGPLTGLTGLKRLSIGGDNLFGGDISPLAGLTGLEWLKVNDANVGDLSPLENLPKLKNLNISANGRITDFEPLVCLPKLEVLHLRNMRRVFNTAGLIVDPHVLYLAEHKTPSVLIHQ